MPSSLARIFAVPAGSSAMGTWLPASPLTISLIVPSPPQAITIPRRCSTACRAIVVADAGRGRRREFRGDARIIQNARGLFHIGKAAMPSAPARRVVDQKRVFDFVWHRTVPKITRKRALYNTRWSVDGPPSRRDFHAEKLATPPKRSKRCAKKFAATNIFITCWTIRRFPTRPSTADGPLRELEAEHPELADARFAHAASGRRAARRFSEVRHKTPMVSLDNAFSFEALGEFDRRVRELTGREKVDYVGRAQIRWPEPFAALREAANLCAALRAATAPPAKT